MIRTPALLRIYIEVISTQQGNQISLKSVHLALVFKHPDYVVLFFLAGDATGWGILV